jgi:hypothetical protein
MPSPPSSSLQPPTNTPGTRTTHPPSAPPNTAPQSPAAFSNSPPPHPIAQATPPPAPEPSLPCTPQTASSTKKSALLHSDHTAQQQPAQILPPHRRNLLNKTGQASPYNQSIVSPGTHPGSIDLMSLAANRLPSQSANCNPTLPPIPHLKIKALAQISAFPLHCPSDSVTPDRLHRPTA